MSGANTTLAIIGLNPFTNYTCILYGTTVSNGPATNPITVRTAEQGTNAKILQLHCKNLSLSF